MKVRLSSETIAVIGVGYVGLPTAACLTSFGHLVFGFDANAEKISDLSDGKTSMLEPGLQGLLRDGLASKRLRFTSSLYEAVKLADIVFLCLPTPQGKDGAADMSIIYATIIEIKDYLKIGAIIVIKSSVPMGESSEIERLVSREDIQIVSNPEFLREGHAIQDTLNPRRIVAGARNREAARRIASLFESGGAPTLITDNVTAETVKYASNAFLAAKTSFINQVASLCDVVGADSEEVLRGMSLDPRIGSGHMRPGPGWGGPCLSKDSRALLKVGETHGFDFTMVRASIDANERQLKSIVQKVSNALSGQIENKMIAIWGLTFKAETDDMRNSPAVDVAKRLTMLGANIRAYDPMSHRNETTELDFLRIFEDPYEACNESEALVILTEWNEFKTLDFDIVGSSLQSKIVIDARNILDPHLLRSLGFTYVGLGR